MTEASFPDRLPVGSFRKLGTGWWGAMMLIATEAALFAYLLFGYYYFAAQFGRGWGPPTPPKLDLALPNTAILLASSGAVWFAERNVKRGGRVVAALALLVTIGLGAVFVGIQIVEWGNKSFTPDTDSYGSLYFTITGFHMAHVAAGMLMLLATLVWTALGYFDQQRHGPVVISAAYWHFVDAVWLAVFFTFYITPRLI